MNATMPERRPSAPGEAPPTRPAVPENLARVLDALNQMIEDSSLPRNIRRGAQAARDELLKPNSAPDVRVATTLALLDDLANDSNLPIHGRTVIWSIISQLESLQ
jgi:uncharacterized protein (UPF0147 family)